MADTGRLHQELVQVVLVGRPLADVLGEITSIARRAMPGPDAVSITLIRGEEPFTAAHDGAMALEADELQYARGYGPCMDAGRSGQVFQIEDMRTEGRWPDYARHAAAAGVGSSLSVPLPFQAATIGGLNSYSAEPGAFGEDDVVLGTEIATWVASAVANASAAAATAEDAANMWAAMSSRAEIEQAKGILVERYKVTPEQAFNLLTRASQQSGAKLRAVAEELVRTGHLAGSS